MQQGAFSRAAQSIISRVAAAAGKTGVRSSGGKSAQIRIVPGDMRSKNQVSASEISDFVSYINDNKNNIIVRPTITSDIVPYIYKILNQEVSNE